MRDLDRWRALTAEERRLLAAAFAWLPLVALGVRIAGFEPVRAVLARTASGVAPAGGDLAGARRVARMVAIAGRRGLVRASCVPQALLSWWILRRRGIETKIRIGVRREAGALRAHAWVEHSGLPLEDRDPAQGAFNPFDRDLASPGSRTA